MTDEVLIDNEGGVRIITLNRPDRLNALTGSIMAPLADACADASPTAHREAETAKAHRG